MISTELRRESRIAGVLVNSDAYVAITVPIDKEFAETNEIDKVESIEFDVLMEDEN